MFLKYIILEEDLWRIVMNDSDMFKVVTQLKSKKIWIMVFDSIIISLFNGIMHEFYIQAPSPNP
jgi:hypothetical protein